MRSFPVKQSSSQLFFLPLLTVWCLFQSLSGRIFFIRLWTISFPIIEMPSKPLLQFDCGDYNAEQFGSSYSFFSSVGQDYLRFQMFFIAFKIDNALGAVRALFPMECLSLKEPSKMNSFGRVVFSQVLPFYLSCSFYWCCLIFWSSRPSGAVAFEGTSDYTLFIFVVLRS